MRKALPLLVLALAVGGAVVFLLGDDVRQAEQDLLDEEGQTPGEDDGAGVLLEGDPEAAARLAREQAARDQAAQEAAARELALARSRPQTLLRARIVDDATDKPIANATCWLEGAQQPCPRLPMLGAWVRRGDGPGATYQHESPVHPPAASDKRPSPRPPPASATERSDADGRIRMQIGGEVDLAQIQGGFDLFVTADGYVPGVMCALPNGRDVEVRLRKGMRLRGTVRSVLQRPVEGVLIRAVPADGTDRALGHYAWAVTDKEGRYELDGLKAGALLVTATHQTYIGKRVGPADPAQQPTLDIELVSALLVTFSLETVNGEPPKNASVQWTTNGTPPHTGLQLLEPMHDKSGRAMPGTWTATNGKFVSKPFAVPCDHAEVRLIVKAQGHATWRSEPLLLPQEGGAKTVPVQLLPDTTRGTLRVRFETEGGEAVAYTQLKASEKIFVRGPQKVEGGLVEQYGADYQLNGIPPGPYMVAFRMPAYAPAEVEFEVAEGDALERTVTLRPAAKVRVRFLAPEPMKVTFRIMKDGRVAPAFPESMLTQPVDPNAPDTSETPVAESSDDGVVFTGLGRGAHVIEVLDAKLRATPTRVDLIEGEETEVEVRVERR